MAAVLTALMVMPLKVLPLAMVTDVWEPKLGGDRVEARVAPGAARVTLWPEGVDTVRLPRPMRL